MTVCPNNEPVAVPKVFVEEPQRPAEEALVVVGVWPKKWEERRMIFQTLK